MSLECSFVPSLYKLLLYTSGSFFKPHRDSEKEKDMFGTLVIQLPSQFEGGQLVVRHDGRTKTFDFSSSGSANNCFCTYFSAFYCDCEHEILPVTEGHRMCLVYNMIAVDTSIPRAPQNRALEMELVALLRNWKKSRKLVYALSHKYSQSNLSLKSLKTTDKIVASILKRVSKTCDLNIYLALLEKDCNGYGDGYGDENEYSCRGCASDFDEDLTDNEVSYELKELISVINNEKMNLSSLKVDFTKEVIPGDCFDSIKPYQQDCEHTGNEGVQISKSYRCTAITFWPKNLTFQVLSTSDASKNLVDTLFLKEAEQYFNSDCNAETKMKILEWAKFAVAKRRYNSSKEDSTAIITTILKFNDIGLIQNLIRHVVVSVPETLALVIDACEQYGWEHFSTATIDLFKSLSQKNAIENLALLIGNGILREEKKKVFSALLGVIFDKGVVSHNYYYSSETKIKQQKEDKDMLEPLINTMMRFDDLQLLQQVVNCIFPLHSETISLLTTICDKYGWEPFATPIADKFIKLSKRDAVITLTLLVENGSMNEDKKTMCLKLFKMILDKTGELTTNTTYSYQRFKSEAEVINKIKEEKALLEPLINAAVILNDLELVQNLFQHIVPLNSETIPLLTRQCEIHGWKAFDKVIAGMFEKLSLIHAIEMFSYFIEKGNLNEEKMLCFNLFQLVLDKRHPLPMNNYRPITQDEKTKHQKEEQDILYSICLMAEKIKFNLTSFAKTKPFQDFVPVLLRLPKEATCLDVFWGSVAFHFIAEMGKESVKMIQMSWRRETNSVTVCCNDCVVLNAFLQSNKEYETFRIGEKRRKHLQQKIDLMEKMAHRTDIGGRGQVGVLIVTKTKMSGAEALQTRNLSKGLLARLRSVMPYN